MKSEVWSQPAHQLRFLSELPCTPSSVGYTDQHGLNAATALLCTLPAESPEKEQRFNPPPFRSFCSTFNGSSRDFRI